MPNKKFQRKFFSSRASQLGSNKKTPKKSGKGTGARGFAPPSKKTYPNSGHKTWAQRQKKKPNPDIHVKRSAYSRVARDAVLASAAARQQLIEMGGENTITIIREFDKDMSDEELARKTSIKASDVRVVLNRLHNHGLFSYTRVRDKDSGWYSYIWKMSEGRLREVVMGAAQPAGAEEFVENTIEGENYFRKNAPQQFDGEVDPHAPLVEKKRR